MRKPNLALLVATLCLYTACSNPAEDAAVVAPHDAADAPAADSLFNGTENDAAAAQNDTTPTPACKTDKDCSANTPYCVSAFGSCQACRYAQHCPGPGGRCVAGACLSPTPCASDKSCAAMSGVCDKGVGYCVACLTNAECSKGLVCRANQCLPLGSACKSSKECVATAQLCDAASGTCADCTLDTDCADGEFCTEGLCLPDICSAGQASCLDSKSQKVCSSNGGAWLTQPCNAGLVCSGTACVGQVCGAGQLQCQGSEVHVCTAGGTGWTPTVDCATTNAVCINGACAEKVCKPGESKCSTGEPAAGFSTCNADGTCRTYR